MDESDKNGLIQHFEKLGLNSNEAKVYMALRENYPVTGYQLSKNSGILRPVVYEMLNRLVEKGGAKIIKSNPEEYVPAPIEEFLKNIENGFKEAKDIIMNKVESSSVGEASDYFWNIIGERNIINAFTSAIEKAESEIYLSINSQDILNKIQSSLEEAQKARVTVTLFSYHSLDTKSLTLYSFGVSDRYKIEKAPENHVMLFCGNQQAFIANFGQGAAGDKSVKAVQSANPVFMNTVKDHIIGGIYSVRFWKFFGADKTKLLLNNEDKKCLEMIEKYRDKG